MKNIFYALPLFLLFLSIIAQGQQTLNKSFTHGGITRDYTIYIPSVYNSSTSASLVLNLHGYGSNDTQQLYYGDFRAIADTAGFILLVPRGTDDGTGSLYWNSGWGGNVDDIAFINTLLDTVSANYNINQDRIFSTGMSNGGFMSYTLACSLSNRIAAIASVTGAMNSNQNNSCAVTRPMPVMEIHGTADPTVPYNGNTTMQATPATVDFWVNHNNCTTTPITTSLPNTNITDGSNVERYIYSNGDNNSEVILYKIIDGVHSWPGANFGVTNKDFNASAVIWEFFYRYNKTDLEATSTSLAEKNTPIQLLSANPTNGKILFSTKKTTNAFLYDTYGRLIKVIPSLPNNIQTVDISNFPAGLYFLKTTTETLKIMKIE